MENTQALPPKYEAAVNALSSLYAGWLDRLCASKDQQPATPKRMAQLRRKRRLTLEEAYELWSNESGFRPYLVEPHAMKLAGAKDQ